MPDFSATWKQLLADLERERDELKVQAHLAKAEARDLLAKSDAQLTELRSRLTSAGSAAKEGAGKVGEKALETAKEIRAAFAKVRGALGKR